MTNVTWEHFWLNEGFTVYLERSILRRLAGEPQLLGILCCFYTFATIQLS